LIYSLFGFTLRHRWANHVDRVDDTMLTAGASGASGGDIVAGTVYWGNWSSSPYLTPATSGAAGVHWTSSTIWPDGTIIPMLAPVAALRLNSTALSSNTLTLKVLQGEAW
jgi:hypothetical protein